jgi:cell division septation protein DedD
MIYEFSFDGKSLWALCGGSLVLSGLLFLAGVLTGANWNAHEAAAPQPQAAAPATPTAAPATQNAAALTAAAPAQPYAPPPGPFVYGMEESRAYVAREYDPARADAPGYAAPRPAPRDDAARAYGSESYGASQFSAAPPAAPRDEPAAPPADLRREAARLGASGISADPRLISEAEAEQPPSLPGYAVQVGAYVEESDARRMLGELENKGYMPSVFTGRDAVGRTWYTVRIGAYANQREASRAAGNFSRQERLQAVVRPANSL